MTSPLAASQILDEQFLTVRSKLIDLAATLDRMDRAAVNGNGSSVESDPRIKKIREAVQLLLETGPGRAEKMQLLFSLPYKS